MRSTRERNLWAQFDPLKFGSDFTSEDIKDPQILAEDIFGDPHPGSIRLDRLDKIMEGYEHGTKH